MVIGNTSLIKKNINLGAISDQSSDKILRTKQGFYF